MKKKTFISKFLLVALSIFLFIGTVCYGIFSVGFSAPTSIMGVNDILLTAANEGEWVSNSMGQLYGSVTGEEGGTCSSDSDKTTSMNFKYTNSIEGNVIFDYKVILNGGTCTIDNITINENNAKGSYSKILKFGESFDIMLKSAKGVKTTSIKITNFGCYKDEKYIVNFAVTSNGTYSFDDKIVENEFDLEVVSGDEHELEAFANSDFEFYGWSFNGKIISKENPYKIKFGNTGEICPIFVGNEQAVFSNDGAAFTNLEEANQHAKNSEDQIIRLEKTGKLMPEGVNYRIDSGNILYIPNDGTTTIYENEDMMTSTYSEPQEYMRLDIGENTKLTIESNSSIYVAAKNYIGNGSNTHIEGTVCGGYGAIQLLSETSIIELQFGSTLYCYGFIFGLGKVEAQNGSDVHELFQVGDFRGGSALIFGGLLGNKQKVFLFNQYFIQNIESEFYIYNGADIITHAAFDVSGVQSAHFNFLGTNGIFKIRSGYIKRYYNPKEDRVIYSINGEADLSSIVLRLTQEINSADYVLPIASNFTVDVNRGSRVNINQNICFLPSSILNIEEGAEVVFNSGTYLIMYDNEFWYNKKYSIKGDIVTIEYVGSLKGKPNVRQSSPDTPDAEIDINGSIIINNGALYSTFQENTDGTIIGGANIHSSNKTGKINILNGLGKETTTYQATQSGSSITTKMTYHDIPIGNALLKNGINSDSPYFNPNNYEGDFINKTIYFDANKDSWSLIDSVGLTRNITYINPENPEQVFNDTYIVGQSYTFETNGNENVSFSFNNYSLKKWKISDINVVDPGYTYSIMEDFGDIEAVAVWGGWVNLSTNYLYLDYDSGRYLTGLNRVETYDNSTETRIYLFNENGTFESAFTGVYNYNGNFYMIEKGVVVEQPGFYQFVPVITQDMIPEYVYITGDNTILVNKNNMQIYTENDDLPSGIYSFNENGYVVKEDSEIKKSDGNIYANPESGITYIDGIKVSYGLFTYDNHYYYSDSNCKIVKNSTHYVRITNGLNILEGLYYFDENGYLCSPQTLQPMEVNA